MSLSDPTYPRFIINDAEPTLLDYGPEIKEAIDKVYEHVPMEARTIGFEHDVYCMNQTISRVLGERISHLDQQNRKDLKDQHDKLIALHIEEQTGLIRQHQEEIAKLHREYVIASNGATKLARPEEIVNAVMRLQFINTDHERHFARLLLEKWCAAPRSA